MIGSTIHRSFGPLGVHSGRITSSRKIGTTTLYLITYDDEDTEELDEVVVLELLHANENNDGSNGDGTNNSNDNNNNNNNNSTNNHNTNNLNDEFTIDIDSASNTSTNDPDSIAEPPTEKWYAYWSDEYDRFYYFNSTTKITTWTMPDNFVDDEKDTPEKKLEKSNSAAEALNVLNSSNKMKGEGGVMKIDNIGASSLSLDSRLALTDKENLEMRQVKRKIVFIMVLLSILLFLGNMIFSRSLVGVGARGVEYETEYETEKENVIAKEESLIVLIGEKVKVVKAEKLKAKTDLGTAAEALGDWEIISGKVKHKWKCNVPLLFQKSCLEIRSIKKKRRSEKRREKKKRKEQQLKEKEGGLDL